MAVILLVLGAIAGLIAASAVKRGAPPVPTMAIEEARKIRETVEPGARRRRRPRTPRPPRRRPSRCRRRVAGTRRCELMAQRSPAEIRSSIESNRMELAVSVERLRGEVARITDWRGQLERHRSELMIGAAVVGLGARRAPAAPPPARADVSAAHGRTRGRVVTRALGHGMLRLAARAGSPPTPIRPGPV